MSSPIITHLFIKKQKGALMSSQHSLSLKKEYGVEGDINASPWSIRQILITRDEDLEELHIEKGSLRENIIIRGISLEQFQPGALLQIGDAKIRLTFYCEPCYIIADAVPSMKAVFHRRGILGIIEQSGQIRIHDTVETIPNHYTPLSEKSYERFVQFIQHIPAGKIVDYRMIVTAIGVAPTTMRVIPHYIKMSLAEGHSVHRIVDTAGNLIEKYIPEQALLLQKEGVNIRLSDDGKKSVDMKQYLLQEPPVGLLG